MAGCGLLPSAGSTNDATRLAAVCAESCSAAGTPLAVAGRYGSIRRERDPRVAESLAAATGNYRQGMVLTAQRLADIGALKPDVTVATATDVLWFYFGYSSYFTLTDENGWSLAEAEKWLLAQVSSALLP
jgi:hypothetical protein